MADNPAKSRAEVEAAKRERHKSPGLSHKRWAAVHDPVKGWHVALIDDHRGVADAARFRAFNAYRRGDFNAFIEAAHESLMAKVRAELEDPTPEAEGDA